MSEHEVPCLRVLKVEGRGVGPVSWSPDGTCLAIGADSGTVEVLTAESRSLWRVEAHEKRVYGVAWSPDGRRLASSSFAEPGVRVWDFETGRPLLSLTGGDGWAVAWSPDGGRLAWTPGADLVVSDAITGDNVVTCENMSLIYSVDWSPEGRQIASGSEQGAVGIWEAESGQLVAKLEDHGADVDSVKWSPDGRRLACGGIGVRIWDVVQHHCLMHCGTEDVLSVSWSVSGDLVAAGLRDGTVSIWDAETGRELARFRGHTQDVESVAFSPDGFRLASAGDGARIWDIREIVARQSGKSGGDAELLFYAARQAATVGRRSSTAPRERWVPRLPEAEGACLGMLRGTGASGVQPGVDILPDSQALVTGHPDGLLRKWDLSAGKPIWVASTPDNARINDVKISPDGSLIASGCGIATARIWSAENGDCLKTFTLADSGLRVSWSPRGDRIAVASNADAFEVVQVATGETVLYRGHSRHVWGVSWSPDGQRLASAAWDQTVRIWDAQTGLLIHGFEAHSDWASDVKWSPDGHLLASSASDATVAIWESGSWDLRLRYRGHQKSSSTVYCLAWSPRGDLIASVGKEKVVRVWEVTTGRDLAEFPFEGGYAWRVVWSPDGAFLVSSHYGDVFRFWDTRQLTGGKHKAVVLPTTGPLSRELGLLTEAFAGLHRLSLYPPLSLLRETLDLTGGERREGVLADLCAHPGIRAFASLNWPVAARVGLVALLLRGVPLEDWKPPGRVSSSEMIEALAQALRGEPVEPDPPPFPISLLQQAAEAIDDRLVTLLTAVGPQAVAADPGLPLRLLPRFLAMPKLTAPQRRLLGLRLRSGTAGRSLGYGSGSERSGVELRGDLRSLLPSQLALPEEVLTSRHLRGELLYRARTGEEAPRLRPAVLVLDISPASFGPVETTTRLAAHVLASSLLQAGLPVVLVTAGGRSEVYSLERMSDLVEVWTRRSLEPAEAGRSFGVARALRETLREGPLEPVIVLLTHAYFGTDEELPAVSCLRGLFVQYPGHAARPRLASACERWESLLAGEMADLAEKLARVAG